MHHPDTKIAAGFDESKRDVSVGIAAVPGSSFEELHIVARPGPRSVFAESLSQTAQESIIPTSNRSWRDTVGAAASRTLDITATLILLIVLLPVLVLLSVVVAIDSGGSPIFAHNRVGRGGRSFKCYKFRSMCANAEAKLVTLLQQDPVLRREWAQHHKLANDPRITPLGHFLRKTSLDELPQLFNVLAGEMSLVGPRPVVYAEIARYGRFKSSYLSMRPGITGLWQVTCRSESTYRRRVAIDRIYAKKKSLVLDCAILLATVPAVLSRKGAC
jgi:lipopolysaccharide/colanic/teichoic acid biosynthesis glycosyltransferase